METEIVSDIQKKILSGSFSAFVVSCLKGNPAKNRKNMGIQEIAHAIGKEEDFVHRIKNGEVGFTIEDLFKLGKAYGEPISSLLQREINKKKVPTELKQTHKNLSNLLIACERLLKTSEKATPSIPIKDVPEFRKKITRAKKPVIPQEE